jgi:hypothetical protein
MRLLESVGDLIVGPLERGQFQFLPNPEVVVWIEPDGRIAGVQTQVEDLVDTQGMGHRHHRYP